MKDSELDHIKELEEKTIVHTVDLATKEGRDLIHEYVKEHKKEGGAPEAAGSFNEFLKERFKADPDYQGKVVVAEIKQSPSEGQVRYHLGKYIGSQDVDREFYAERMSRGDIDINGGDFTGTQISDVVICSAENVSFRDCNLEGISVEFDNFHNVDLRGCSMEECSFKGQVSTSKSHGVKVGFANPDLVQDKNAFTLFDHDQFLSKKRELFESKEHEQFLKEKEEEIAEVPKKKEAQGWMEWATSGKLGKGEFRLEDYDFDGQQEIKKIEEKYERKKEKRLRKYKRECKIRFKDPICDPTYTPNQTPDQAKAPRLYVPVTKQDLEDYKQSDQKLSFNEFIAGRHGEPLEAGTVVIADFKEADLSGMDLQGLNLNGVNLAYCKMEGCDLKGANLRGACLEGATFDSKTNFQEANLIDTNMIGASGESVNFEKAIMIRTRIQSAKLPHAKMEHAQMYAVNGAGADLSHADMQHVDARKGKLKGAVLRSVDARHANLEGAILTDAILEDANFRKTNLNEAVLTRVQAERANLEEATMNEVRAEQANFRKAILDKVAANGGIFTEADFEEVQAQEASFRGAMLKKINARFGNFSGSVLEDVKAEGASFSGASLKKVKAARIDLQDAMMTKVKAAEADLTEAAMQGVEAYKGDFTKAVLSGANLEKGNFTAASLKEAALDHAKAKTTKFIRADLEGADVTDMEFDDTTLLLDANLRGIIGEKEGALHELQEKQHKLHKRWFGHSRYGRCASNPDGSNDRFMCQRVGSMVLSAALAGGAGFTLAGPFGGVSTALVSAFVGDKAITAIQQGYFEDLGYIDNILGDKLAEIGAIAMAAGVGAADRAIDGAAVGLILTSAGAITGVMTAAVGTGAAIGGVSLAWSGHKKESRLRKIGGAILAGVGTVTAFIGLSSLSTSISTIGYFTAGGAALGAGFALRSSITRLWNYEEDSKGKMIEGARPEHIYRESIERGWGILRKIIPTKRKLLIGAALAVTLAGGAYLAVGALPVLGGFKIFAAVKFFAATVPAMISAGTAGFLGGYLYDNKVVGAAKFVGRMLLPFAFHDKTGTTSGSGSKEKTVEQDKALPDQPAQEVEERAELGAPQKVVEDATPPPAAKTVKPSASHEQPTPETTKETFAEKETGHATAKTVKPSTSHGQPTPETTKKTFAEGKTPSKTKAEALERQTEEEQKAATDRRV